MTNWKIGMKVVCVDDTHSHHLCFMDVRINIKKGDVYQIRGFDIPRDGIVGIYLVGVYQRPRRGGPGHGQELAWHPNRFRPLLSDEQEALDRIEQEVNEPEPAFA